MLISEKRIYAMPVISLLAVFYTFCGPSTQKKSHGGNINFDEMMTRFSNPSGEVSSSSINNIINEVLKLNHFSENMAKVVNTYPSFAGLAPVENKEGTTTGSLQDMGQIQSALTFAYVKYSCPGPDLTLPDFNFGHGFIQVETDDLLSSNIYSGLADFLFEKCVISKDRLEGFAYGKYFSDKKAVALSIELKDFFDKNDLPEYFKNVQDDFFDFKLDIIIQWPSVSFLLYSDNVTIVLNIIFSVTGKSVSIESITLKGTNGTYNCDLTIEKFSCTGPNGEKIDINFQL